MATGPRVLVVSGNVRNSVRDGTLVDDLIGALSELGAEVSVLDMSLAPKERQSAWPGVRVVSVGGPVRGLPSSAARFVATGRAVQWAALNRDLFDVVVYFSPAFLSGAVPWAMRLRGTTGNTSLVLWDFFPIHQVQIGRLPSLGSSLLKKVERGAIDVADRVLVMTPGNRRFLEAYHVGIQKGKRIDILPPWGGEGSVVGAQAKRDEFTVVFGGQLVRGRGVETLLEAAKIVEDRDLPIVFEIFGDGPERDALAQKSRDLGLKHLEFRGRVPREDYLNEIAACHVGVAVTVPNVSVPTFPSKSIDYARAGLPVVACLEESSDAGRIIEGNGAGVYVPAGDPGALASALAELHAKWLTDGLSSFGDAARRWYVAELSGPAAARSLLVPVTGDRPIA